eukprot:14954190-Ditylum_brightwellii.AAC.1
MSNLPTNGITKETDFEKSNFITDNKDSDGESVSAQAEVVSKRENPLNKDAPVLSELEWNDEMNQYNIVDKVRFLSENSRDLVEIMGCNTVDRKIKYIVKFPNKYQMETTEEFLQPNLPDLAKIPVTKEEYAAESKHLTAEECSRISKAECLDPMQQE